MAGSSHMHQPSVEVITAVVFLGSAVVAVLRAKRDATARRSTLRFAVSSLWMLDHLSRAAGAVLESGPEPDCVIIDLSAISFLDDTALTSLDYACAHWARAGVAVTFEGCQPCVAERIARRGLRAEIRREPLPDLGSGTRH